MIFLFFVLFLTSCQGDPLLVQHVESGFQMTLPCDFRAINATERALLDGDEGSAHFNYVCDDFLLSIWISPHTQIEAEDGALQILMNATLRDVIKKSGKELFLFQQLALSGAVGCEAVVGGDSGGKMAFTRMVLADNRRYELQIRLSGASFADVDSPRVIKMMESLEF